MKLPKIPDLARLHRDDSHRTLFIAAALGDLDRAFQALELQTVDDPQRVPLILTYPELAVLRGDPRLGPGNGFTALTKDG